jgi:Na+-driven multidrug efflux pump
VGGRWFFSLYFDPVTESHAIELGVQIMRLMVFIVLMQVSQVIYMGCLRGAGDVRFTTIASTISVTLIRPLTSFFFAYTLSLGVIGIWLGVVADQLCRLILTNWRFASGKWTTIKI